MYHLLEISSFKGLIRYIFSQESEIKYSAFFFSSFLQFRLVGKTALKLLLVFVEYTESNSRVLHEGIQAVDGNQGIDFQTLLIIITQGSDTL